MLQLFRHKWTLFSGATTAVHCTIIYGVVNHLNHRDLWHPDSSPTSHSVVALEWVHFLGIAVAIGMAVVGIRLERPPIFAVIALLLGVLSFFIFVG